MTEKRFTPGEANAMLPELKEELKRLQELTAEYQRQFAELQKQKAAYKHPPGGRQANADPFFAEEGRIDFMRMEIDLLIGNFARKGVLLKMISPGLLDFPAVIDGKDVLICWKEGEETITHYHGWNDGFVGRKPLPDV